jgi:hypothetical protein
VSLFAILFSELYDDLLRNVISFTLLDDLRTEEQPGDFRFEAQLFNESELKIRLILRSERGLRKEARRNRSVTKFQVVVIRVQFSDGLRCRAEDTGDAHHVLVQVGIAT